MTPLPAYWPERMEGDDALLRQYYVATKALREEEAATRQSLIEAGTSIVKGTEAPPFHSYGTHVPRTAAEFDLDNMACFAHLPSIRARMSFAEGVLAGMRVPDLPAQLGNQLHVLYHLARWRLYGRRVYVLDERMYHLLAQTPLPNLPAPVLSARLPSFYVRFPDDAFRFCVADDPGRPQPAEGVMVGLDRIEPDRGNYRELSILLTGRAASLGDCNMAYLTCGLGADARLSEVRFGGVMHYGAGSLPGDEHLTTTVPRVVLGLLLYLASEHPDLEPVPPAPRREFKEIRSPQQRAKAIEREERRGQSRLGYILVGRRVGEESRRQEAGVARHWKLDRQVWVSGHWKRQFYGPNREFRRTIWIRPYVKGPDMAESLAIRAARIQPAQRAGTEMTR